MNLYIDRGATYIRYQIENGNIITIEESDIVSLIRELTVKYNIKRAYISFAGEVRDNIIISAPNIDIERLDLSSYFPDIQFKIDNDLNCAVLAEAKYWSSRDIVALYIGTGIGAGAISGGDIVRGFSNLAGEIGHIPFKKAPFSCGCGKDNCIELFTSGSAIKKWANYLNQDFKRLEDMPQEIYSEFLEGVLYASATLITLFNPQILVLGGGVIEKNSFLVEYIKQNIDRYAYNPNLKDLKIVQTKLKDAPLKGAKFL